MASIRNLINRFLDWCDKLGRESLRQNRKTKGIYTIPRNDRKKAVRLADETLFGIGRKG